MNNSRRNQIKCEINLIHEKMAIIEKCTFTKTFLDEDFSIDVCELESIKEDEQNAFDNLPESFQNGERGEQMQLAIDSIDSALSQIEEAENLLTETKENDLPFDEIYEKYNEVIELLSESTDYLNESLN